MEEPAETVEPWRGNSTWVYTPRQHHSGISIHMTVGQQNARGKHVICRCLSDGNWCTHLNGKNLVSRTSCELTAWESSYAIRRYVFFVTYQVYSSVRRGIEFKRFFLLSRLDRVFLGNHVNSRYRPYNICRQVSQSVSFVGRHAESSNWY